MTDSWDQNYREIVREYGPPLDRPSLFIFGRDEYIRSESRGNEELKDSVFNPEYERPKSIADKPPISPPPPPPLPPGWSRSKIKEPIAVQINCSPSVPNIQVLSPTPDRLSPKYQYTTKSHQKFENYDNYRDWIKKKRTTEIETTKKFGWKELNKTPEPKKEQDIKKKKNSIQSSPESTKKFGWKELKETPEPQKEEDIKKKKNSIQSSPESTKKFGWKELKETPEPKKEQDIKKKKNSIQSSPESIENLRGTTKDILMNVAKLEVLQDHNQVQQNNLLQELKNRFEKDEKIENIETNRFVAYKAADLEPNMDNTRIIKETKNPLKSPFSLSNSKQHTRNRENSGSLREIEKLLQTDAIVNPIVENFIRKNFKNFDLSAVDETEVPMKHYWERIFKISDGHKNATVKIENLLTIEPNEQLDPIFHSNFNFAHRKEKFSNNSISEPFEVDLIKIIHQKISTNQPLDWPELFLLKNSHCRHVVPREKLLKKLRKNSYAESAVKEVEKNILESYKNYQILLEKVITKDELYTRLAYLIMKAESYWYAAKINQEHPYRKENYQKALRYYSELLEKSKEVLQPDDRSVLTIVEKISQIFVESGFLDSKILEECRQAIYQAEKELDSKSDIKKERKIIKIKNNLMHFNHSV